MAADQVRILFLTSETTSCFSLNNSDAFLGKIEQRCDGLLNIERTLHRTPNRNALSGNRSGHNGLRLDIKMFLRSCNVGLFDNDIRITPFVRRVATFDLIRLKYVVALERRIHRKDGW